MKQATAHNTAHINTAHRHQGHAYLALNDLAVLAELPCLCLPLLPLI